MDFLNRCTKPECLCNCEEVVVVEFADIFDELILLHSVKLREVEVVCAVLKRADALEETFGEV